MKNEDIFNSISDISPEFTEKAEKYIKRKSIRLKIFIAAACISIIAATASAVILLNKSNAPFVITAYAKESNGAPVANEMTGETDIPVSVFANDDNTSKFVFSYPAEKMSEQPHITIYYSPECDFSEYQSISITYDSDSLAKMPGSVYVYYVFCDEQDSYEFTYRTIPDKNNESYDVSVSIYRKDGNYYAHLNSVKPVEKTKERTSETLKENFPEYFNIRKEQGVEIYIWQMAEDSFRCGLYEKTECTKSKEEIYDLQSRSLSVEEAKIILEEIGAGQEDITVIPVVQPYSSFCYPINDELQQKVDKLFD